MPEIVNCPTCKKEVVWKDSSFRPFCSERCRLIDFGNWAEGNYSIETDEPRDGTEADQQE